ncbi:MAG: winged helix DNA-binding domain-containing protein [Acidimicrobiales bacterium]
MEPVTLRQLNRWTLARQHLLARTALTPEAAVGALAGMQAQAPSAPYIGLWSRLAGFQVEQLEAALRERAVVKTTVMRGTLHLVAATRLAAYRQATGSSYYDGTRRLMDGLGIDVDAVRAAVVARVAERPRSRTEVFRLVAGQIPEPHPAWLAERPSAVAALSVSTDLVNAPGNAAFGAVGQSSYEVMLTDPPSPLDAARLVAGDYLAAYGPATTADLASWSGRPARDFAAALATLDLVRFRGEDGRTLLDLAGAPRPPDETPAPVRFLPVWDSLLLAQARRQRVLADEHRRLVIAPNGDVAPTFLVGGLVAGTWAVPPRAAPATLTLRPLVPLSAADRRAVAAEGRHLVAWLRPDTARAPVVWA